MKAFLMRYATPLTTGLFLVSLVSGVALFFHWGGTLFHGMHEWLSMVLIVPFVLHIWRNWRPMLAYLRHAPMAIALIGSTIAAAAFAMTAPGTEGRGMGGPPPFRLAQQMMQATVAEAAAVLDVTPEALAATLAASGMTAAAPDQTLAAMAKAAGRSDMQAMDALAQAMSN